MLQFTPNAENARLLRDAFGRFATGVTIITASHEGKAIGITANSFSSVSMDPALVLWSGSREAGRFGYFEAADHFAIHILGADQCDLCWQVAKDAKALQDMDLAQNSEGVPLIDGALARFECSSYATYDGGDHAIFVGKVLRASLRDDGEALAFFKGQQGRFVQES